MHSMNSRRALLGVCLLAQALLYQVSFYLDKDL